MDLQETSIRGVLAGSPTAPSPSVSGRVPGTFVSTILNKQINTCQQSGFENRRRNMIIRKSTHLVAISIMAVEFPVIAGFKCVGGGNALARKTERAGEASSASASQAVPSSQLCSAICNISASTLLMVRSLNPTWMTGSPRTSPRTKLRLPSSWKETINFETNIVSHRRKTSTSPEKQKLRKTPKPPR